MVNATKGLLISCDPSIKEFIMNLEGKYKFGVMDLDDSHLLLLADPEILDLLQEEIDLFQEVNTFQAPIYK